MTWGAWGARRLKGAEKHPSGAGPGCPRAVFPVPTAPRDAESRKGREAAGRVAKRVEGAPADGLEQQSWASGR